MKTLICRCASETYCKGLCRNCYERQLRKNNPEFHERQKKNCRTWGMKNKQHKKKINREYQLKDDLRTEKRFFRNILRRYGITKEKYEELVAKSDNRCYLCKRKPYKGRRLHLDHDHKTLRVRGLLCARCNWYMAVIEKDPELINKIKNYLKL